MNLQLFSALSMIAVVPLVVLTRVGVLRIADYWAYFAGTQLIFACLYVSRGDWWNASVSAAFAIFNGVMYWRTRDRDDDDHRRRRRKRFKARVVAVVGGRKLRVVEQH